MGKHLRVATVRLDDDLMSKSEDYVARRQAENPDGAFNLSTFIRSAIRMKLAESGSQRLHRIQRKQGAA